MPVDFSIKRVPDETAQRLRQRAERNRRSLQRELLTILEQAVTTADPWPQIMEPPPVAYTARPTTNKTRGNPRAASGKLDIEQLWQRARALGAPAPGESSTSLIRKDRDARHGR